MNNVLKRLDKIITTYQGKKGSLIPLLQETQNELGFLSRETMEYLAEKTGLKLFKYQRFHKTVNLHYFIRHLFHKFSVFMFLNFLTRIPSINFQFQIDDNSMLVILQKYEKK